MSCCLTWPTGVKTFWITLFCNCSGVFGVNLFVLFFFFLFYLLESMWKSKFLDVITAEPSKWFFLNI